MDFVLTFLLNISLENYTFFLLLWGALGIIAGIATYFAGDLPISSKKDNLSGRWLGSIDKKKGWMIMETPILISVLFFHLASVKTIHVASLMVLAFVIHYVNRALIYPQRIKANGKRMPVSTMTNSMIFYTINGYLIGYYFGAFKTYPTEWLWDPRFIIGMLMFVAGFLINIQSDNILINLRKPGETEYKIPEGGCFRWVSCPNYFGEIIEWTGFAIMTWSLPGLVYALWVGLPLMSQALLAHRWYVETFAEKYPKSRKAVIPYLL